MNKLSPESFELAKNLSEKIFESTKSGNKVFAKNPKNSKRSYFITPNNIMFNINTIHFLGHEYDELSLGDDGEYIFSKLNLVGEEQRENCYKFFVQTVVTIELK